MEPLRECRFDVITYDVQTDRIDILRHPNSNKGGGGWGKILFHTGKDNVLRFFLGITRSYIDLQEKEKNIENNNMIVFSGKNVLKYLHIQYPPHQDDQIQDLSALSQVIQANFSRINDAFSDENIQTTCLDLSKTEKENLDDIKQAFRDASGFE